LGELCGRDFARVAATAGAPTAVQVADRWRLLLNMRQALERWLARSHARLRRLPALPDGDGRPPDSACAPIVAATPTLPRAPTAGPAGWSPTSRCVVVISPARPSWRLVSRRVSRVGTIRKYAHAESFPERAVRRPNASRLDPYLAHIERRMAEGCENAMALWREVRELGFAGSYRQVHRFVAERRTAPARRTARKWLGREMIPHFGPSAASALPSPKQLAWLLVQPRAALSPQAAAAVARVEQDPETARVGDLARRFTALVRGCGVSRDDPQTAPCGDLDAWLAEARTCEVRALETFAASLEHDGSAVRAALTTPWSNGQAEGQITRLKMLKRTMYGRASFDLLRRRVLLAA